MEKEYGLQRVLIPEEGEAKCPIFISKDLDSNERCMLLIQGSGDVRAGIWARSVNMNDLTSLGSVFPQLDFARQYGYSVIVANHNYNTDEDGNEVHESINDMESHCTYLWSNFISGNNNIKEIVIIAHSAGGVCAESIITRNMKEVKEKVRFVAFTDAR